MPSHPSALSAFDLVGIHFTRARPPSTTYMAWGHDRAGTLVINGLDPIGATLTERLTLGPPRVIGFDVPFGVPLGLARRLVPMVTHGTAVIERIITSPHAETDLVWADFATEHPGALRLTDAITHGAPSITSTTPPSWRSLRAIAQTLWAVRDRVSIVPFDTLELNPSRPTALEVCPLCLLRLLGLPYLHRSTPDRAPVTELTAERLAVIRALPDSVLSLGTRIELAPHLAHALAEASTTDPLDAVLSLVSVYLATRGLWSPPPLAGPHSARVLTEGWIVRPG